MVGGLSRVVGIKSFSGSGVIDGLWKVQTGHVAPRDVAVQCGRIWQPGPRRAWLPGMRWASVHSSVTALGWKWLCIFRARAKRIIFLFMWGGPSHVDLFDPKPVLNREAGKPLAGSSVGADQESLGTVLGSPFSFARHGDGGIWMSELFPELSTARRSPVRGSLDAHRRRVRTARRCCVCTRARRTSCDQVSVPGSVTGWVRERRVYRPSSRSRHREVTVVCRTTAVRFCRRASGNGDRVGRDPNFTGRCFESDQRTD